MPNTGEPIMPVEVFYSYAREDETLQQELEKHLSVFLRENVITSWHDRKIELGEDWAREIDEHINTAQIILLLVSADYLASDYCYGVEMKRALERHRAREARVIPVILRPCDWTHTELGVLQALPSGARPVTKWPLKDDALHDVAKGLGQVVGELRGVRSRPREGLPDRPRVGSSPYRGLQPFGPDHEEFFFGREELTKRLLEKLRHGATSGQMRFLAVIGSSGSGKSSLALAGLVPAIRRGELGDGLSWKVEICRPGPDPIESLAKRLVGSGSAAPKLADLDELIEAMKRGPTALHLWVGLMLRDQPPSSRLVVLIDQFEEVFTLCEDRALRQAFIDNLLYAAGKPDGQTVVVLTLRADFYGKCALHPALIAAVSDRQLLVGPMTEDELRSAIEKPARLAGCELEPGLTDILLQDAEHQAGTLPLLQFALQELWEHREDHRMTIAAYRMIGGLKGALENRANAVLAGFSTAERDLCRRVFLRLAQTGEGTEDTKRRARMSDLLAGDAGATERVVERLVDARLLTAEADAPGRNRGGGSIEVVHTALIRGWKTLRQWIDADRAGLRTHHRLLDAAREWDDAGREPSYLYRGARLEVAREWAETHGDDLIELESEFLTAGLEAQRREERAKDALAEASGNALRAEEEADRMEGQARADLLRFLSDPKPQHLETARRLIVDAAEHDSRRRARLLDEFGFLGTADGSEDTIAGGSTARRERIGWCIRIWGYLCQRNGLSLPDVSSREPEVPDPFKDITGAKGSEKDTIVVDQPARPDEKGDYLEQAVARLFRTFFRVGDDVPWKIRQQRRGTQGGYDLSIEWSGECSTELDPKVRCHIECKNYADPITPKEIAEKLLSEPRQQPVIDHWILISPRSNPSNELNRFIEQQETERSFPFTIQVWCPETGVAELFGLEPEVYDKFFKPPDDEPHPRTWDSERVAHIRSRWGARLKPVLRVPRGWDDYLRRVERFCIHQEDPAKMEATFRNSVTMRCRDSAGLLLEKPLESYVSEWLNTDKQVLFLLGEFGDGKSFFTYALARRLAARWIEDRDNGWLPLRLALRRFPGNAREFLRQRLEEFNAEIAGWVELGKTARRLVILDGFDEMSPRLDSEAITKNIKDLLSCIDEFKGCKILITSRTHFFENRKDTQRLLPRLEDPILYRIAPIQRNEVLGYLDRAVTSAAGRLALSRVSGMNDPVGLASKPLFMEMLQNVLSAPDLPDNLSVAALYEHHITSALKRKVELLDDPELAVDRDVTLRNMRQLLGEIAEDLQSTGSGYVALGKFETSDKRRFAKLLWDLTESDALDQDAKIRVGTRSLLARVVGEGSKDDWPVDFCHRSMREYFVSLRLSEAIEAGGDSASRFLRNVPLNHEIISFAAERWRVSASENTRDVVKKELLELIRNSKTSKGDAQVGASALTLLYRVEPALPRSFDWTRKVFDGADLEEADLSGIDFSNCSFRGANLNNVNFEDANFEFCDMSGVRFEETAPVVALASTASGEELIGVYRDGFVRRWRVRGVRKLSNVIAKEDAKTPCAIGLHQESGLAWMRVGRQWILFSAAESAWNPVSRFAIRDELGEVRLKDDHLTFVVSNDDGSSELSVLNLVTGDRLCAIRTNPARHRSALGVGAVIWSDAEAGVRFESVRNGGSPKTMTLEGAEPTCLDVLPLAGRYLVAVGSSDGNIALWEIKQEGGDWSHRKVHDCLAHHGPVTAVCVLGDTRLASGGADGAIAIISFVGERDPPTVVESRFFLKLRCKGMKIKGLKGEIERERIAKAIAAESRDSEP